MTESQARGLVGTLLTAFPRDARLVTDSTVSLYSSELSKLQSANAAVETVQQLIRHGDHFPTIAEFRSAYMSVAAREKDRVEASREARALPPGEETREFPQEVRDLMARWGGLPSDEDWPEGEEGQCNDCRREARLVEYGSLWVCRPCARKRTRVKGRVGVPAGLDVSERYFENEDAS